MFTRNTLRHNSNGFHLIILVLVVLVIAVIAGIVTFSANKSGVHLKVSNGCKDTDIAVQPVSISDVNGSLTLQATLTMSGQPVSNERVSFWVQGTDSQDHPLENLMGYATTNTQGVAAYKSSVGLSEAAITFGKGGVMNKYEAKFDGNGVTDRTKNPNVPFYCGANATAALTVQ